MRVSRGDEGAHLGGEGENRFAEFAQSSCSTEDWIADNGDDSSSSWRGRNKANVERLAGEEDIASS